MSLEGRKRAKKRQDKGQTHKERDEFTTPVGLSVTRKSDVTRWRVAGEVRYRR